MKNIQYFKLFESRTTELEVEEFIKILKSKCSDFVINPVPLQRYKTKSSVTMYSYINPKMYNREPLKGSSGVVSKHHTILMENLPSWSEFPKRSQSIIASSNISEPSEFGSHCYFIIPFDGAKFGVAPGSDLWVSGKTINSRKYEFNDYFAESLTDSNISDESYEYMMRDMQEYYDRWYKDNTSLNISKTIINIFEQMYKDDIHNVYESFDKYFDPKTFDRGGFTIKDYNGLLSLIDGQLDKSNEIWTDSQCLIIYVGNFGEYGISSNTIKRMVREDFNEIMKNILD